jgi:hypothetical protein
VSVPHFSFLNFLLPVVLKVANMRHSQDGIVHLSDLWFEGRTNFLDVRQTRKPGYWHNPDLCENWITLMGIQIVEDETTMLFRNVGNSTLCSVTQPHTQNELIPKFRFFRNSVSRVIRSVDWMSVSLCDVAPEWLELRKLKQATPWLST